MQGIFEKCQDIAWLCHQRNDLEPPAVALVSEVAAVIDAISATPQCQVARMSGSGATCFGIFPALNQAQTAARTLQHAHPDWWVVSTTLV
jgi:4-diphosphocytidyl-2-C-methyl-D-erythritol kinase